MPGSRNRDTNSAVDGSGIVIVNFSPGTTIVNSVDTARPDTNKPNTFDTVVTDAEAGSAALAELAGTVMAGALVGMEDIGTE